MAKTPVNASWTANSASPYADQSYPNGDRAAGNPLYFEDVSAYSVGASFTPLSSGRGSVVSNEQSFSSGKSAKVLLDVGQGPSACGGGAGFGGEIALPSNVPSGRNIWYNLRCYFPSTMTWGYVFSTSDSSEASVCSKPDDGNGFTKFLVMEPDSGNARIYVQTPANRRSVAQPSVNPDDNLIVNSDTGIFGGLDFQLLPLDQWVDFQMHAYIHETNGFIRAWINDSYIGQVNGPTITSSARSIASFGIGNYWNGIPFTDGGSGQDYFYVDALTVYSDIDGYGAPNGTDSGGRTYITPEVI